ncbi:hypothetical protein KM043_000940 [Ampulex compressa]|nr:hypothetical protein KM043_000940 [Ampulex compressa]
MGDSHLGINARSVNAVIGPMALREKRAGAWTRKELPRRFSALPPSYPGGARKSCIGAAGTRTARKIRSGACTGRVLGATSPCNASPFLPIPFSQFAPPRKRRPFRKFPAFASTWQRSTEKGEACAASWTWPWIPRPTPGALGLAETLASREPPLLACDASIFAGRPPKKASPLQAARPSRKRASGVSRPTLADFQPLPQPLSLLDSRSLSLSSRHLERPIDILERARRNRRVWHARKIYRAKQPTAIPSVVLWKDGRVGIQRQGRDRENLAAPRGGECNQLGALIHFGGTARWQVRERASRVATGEWRVASGESRRRSKLDRRRLRRRASTSVYPEGSLRDRRLSSGWLWQPRTHRRERAPEGRGRERASGRGRREPGEARVRGGQVSREERTPATFAWTEPARSINTRGLFRCGECSSLWLWDRLTEVR